MVLSLGLLPLSSSLSLSLSLFPPLRPPPPPPLPLPCSLLPSQTSSAADSPDLEARLHALAENLIEKQTCIETLSTEKTSLKMQLERLTAASVAAGPGAGGTNRLAEEMIIIIFFPCPYSQLWMLINY